uniref:Uncharacterized protein n=1 Tax=Peronospora matthiolae TaxID=2874970 RepID=A0AAV1V737_9STRA
MEAWLLDAATSSVCTPQFSLPLNVLFFADAGRDFRAAAATFDCAGDADLMPRSNPCPFFGAKLDSTVSGGNGPVYGV